MYLLGTLLSTPHSVLTTPVALRTILPALVLLLPRYSDSELSAVDSTAVRVMIEQIADGTCGHLDMEDLEQEYGATSTRQDSEDDLRRCKSVEAMLRCLEFGSQSTQGWILRNVVEVGLVALLYTKHYTYAL